VYGIPEVNPMKANKNARSTRLAEFLCFAVYSTSLAFGKVYRPLLDELGLTYTQYVTVVALWEEDDQTVGSLGEKLFLESNTLTPILKKLEAMGHVERTRDPADERQVRVRLTNSGKCLREKAFGTDLVEACGMSASEFKRLQKEIVELRTNLLKFAGKES
jgi:MarR family transcriptional regulator, organic hydroperoxide resistance regulator